jgi:hypothetical protein
METPLVVYCYSTFRDPHGRQLLPRGLDWDMDGQSHLAYVLSSSAPNKHSYETINMQDTMELRRAIVHTHNRWCFSKDLPFSTLDDIEQLTIQKQHVLVQWKADSRRVYETTKYKNIKELLISDCALGNAPQVWINGLFHSNLTLETLESVLSAVDKCRSPKLCYKRSKDIIRIERYFEGGIRNYQVWEHFLDNLYALEDTQIIDEHTILGTATLPDWIIGGMLTSRLWIQELGNGNILCLRPLIQDDPTTTDRTFRLAKGKDDDKIARVQVELGRLRYLAGLKHPFDEAATANAAVATVSEKEQKRREQQRRNSKKRFTF